MELADGRVDSIYTCVLIDIESLVVGDTEVWINPVRIEHDSLRKIENVLIEEWHFDVGMSIVEFDRAPKISARDWYADTGFEVFGDVTLKIVEQDEEFAVGRREDESSRHQDRSR